MAEVSVVFPWSTWPMVPMFICGLFLEKTLSEYHLAREEEEATRSRGHPAFCCHAKEREGRTHSRGGLAFRRTLSAL